MIEGVAAALKIIGILLGIFAVWYLNKQIRGWYQKFVNWQAQKDSEAAKKKAQEDREKYSDGVKRPPRG